MSDEPEYAVLRWPLTPEPAPTLSLVDADQFLRGCLLSGRNFGEALRDLDLMDDGGIITLAPDLWAWGDR